MKWPLSLLMLGLLSLGAAPAAAQQPSDAARYPVRAVKVIVPNAAGAALKRDEVSLNRFGIPKSGSF